MKKTGVKTLIASLVAIVLTFATLIGTTFAWFTDSTNSSGNKIQAGTLKVDLELLDKQNGWKSIKESSDPIFNYDNWEPGYTDVKILKVENEGTLALKWKAKFVSNEQLSALADVIEVYVLPSANELAYPTDRNLTNYELKGSVKDFVNTIEETTNGILAEDEVAYLGIALKMQEDAGNAYQGLNLGGAFDIQIVATQYTAEEDSFANDYDANLEITGSGVSATLSDGSTVHYYSEESGFGGRVRLTALPEDLGNEYVVPEEVNDLGKALAGATLDKLTISKNVKYAYKSLEGANVREVVIEDGATTIPNRMFYKMNVDSVVIPDSVKVIEENAFAQANKITSLTIPASVTTAEEAAFQHMVALDTVTFEGDTAIQGYAFRGCAQLRNVYLKGDDVTFIPSTLNGRNSTWFCNGESNNPNTSDITFYVENELVAQRVKTAMGAEATNTPVYIGESLAIASAVELQNAFVSQTKRTLDNEKALILIYDMKVDANNTISVVSGKKIVLNLNDHKISATANKTGNQEVFLVKGDFIVKNGSLELIAENNQGWNAMATIFDVTSGGVLTLTDVTANVSGTDMNFVVHLNNWGSATLTVDNCDFTTTYVAVRAFNSGYDMNDITIKNTDFHGGRMFWVHNYTSEGKDDSMLTLNIYNNNNTSDNAKPVRFGFSESTYYDLNGNVIE